MQKPSNIDSEIQEFTEWLDSRPLARSSKKVYINAARRMVESIPEITEHDVNEWISSNPRVYNRTAAFYYLRFKGLHKDIELVKTSDPPAKIQERPDHREWKGMLERIRRSGDAYADLYWTGTLLFYTGARINEVLSLKFKNIRADDSSILFEKIGRSVKKSDLMPIPPKVMAELYTWLANEKGLLTEDRCLYTRYSKPAYAYNQYRTEVETLMTKGVLTEKEGTFMRKSHTFRRSYTDMMDEITGGNIVAVQNVRRDQDVRTTVRYLDSLKKERKGREAKAKFLHELEES